MSSNQNFVFKIINQNRIQYKPRLLQKIDWTGSAVQIMVIIIPYKVCIQWTHFRSNASLQATGRGLCSWLTWRNIWSLGVAIVQNGTQAEGCRLTSTV